jgi:trimethylamine:corrinoid methyltransferase-like protein
LGREGVNLCINEKLWNPLTKKEIDVIEKTSYKMLEEVGFSIEVDEILKICKNMGCHVDMEKKVTTFPKEIIDEYIKKAPKNIFLAGRIPENNVVFEPGEKTFFMAGTAAPRITKWNDEVQKKI